MDKEESVKVEELPLFSEGDYYNWLQHPCTKSLYSALVKAKAKAKGDMASESLAFAPNCQLMLVQLWGFIVMCDLVLKSDYKGLLAASKEVIYV
jgi:hypothetical protein